jgi:hypothetical protein
MRLYQKKLNRNAKHIHDTLPIEDWNPSLTDPYCFYYNWCDQVYNIKFDDFLDSNHISFLQANPKVKVIYDFNGEPILESIILNIIDMTEKWQLNPYQLIITVSNKLQREFVEKRFKNNKITILEFNYDVSTMLISETDRIVPHKKFSVMCRLHRPWRSYLMCRLKEQNLLDHFHYSFLGCENDMTDAVNKTLENDLDITTILTTGNWKILNNANRIKRDLLRECCYITPASVNDFIDNCPHYIEKEHFKSDAETPQELFATDVHLIIENGFFDLEESKYTVRSVEMGEKTWKAIMTSKPFIIYSDQGYLKNLRYLGFKTFSSLINEDYDNEPDPKTRAELIIDEVERINALPSNEYFKLLEECRLITKHNYRQYLEIKGNTPNFLEINFNNL